MQQENYPANLPWIAEIEKNQYATMAQSKFRPQPARKAVLGP